MGSRPNYRGGSSDLAFHRLQFHLILYCIYRFTNEAIRPEPSFVLGLTIFQWTMLLFGIGLSMQWFIELRYQAGQESDRL